MVKKFSTVGDTQRGSQSYMEKRRGRKKKDGSLNKFDIKNLLEVEDCGKETYCQPVILGENQESNVSGGIDTRKE